MVSLLCVKMSAPFESTIFATLTEPDSYGIFQFVGWRPRMETTHQTSPIDAYISTFPANVQNLLNQMRQVIAETAPQAVEKISYGMPTFFLRKNLVHFAAAKHHIGFYPSPSGVQAYKDELAQYKTSKGAIQFPLDKPLPKDLIARIVAFRVKENMGL
jgi:uncharacterized protein YdhG (YjbR/CyaY superfamily)